MALSKSPYKNILAIIFIAFFGVSHAETSEKELKNNLANSKGIRDSIVAIIDLSEHYRFTNPDKGLVYAKQALHLSYKIHITLVKGLLQVVELRFFYLLSESHLRRIQIQNLCIRLVPRNPLLF